MPDNEPIKLSQKGTAPALEGTMRVPLLLTLAQAGSNPAQRNPTTPLADVRAFALAGGANALPVLLKAVDHYDATAPGHDPTRQQTLVGLDPAFLCLKSRCYVINPQPGQAAEYTLEYTTAGPGTMQVWRDGRFATSQEFSDAAWYPVGSPEAAAPEWASLQANPPAADYNFPAGFLLRHPIDGVQYFFKALAAGVLPAPSTLNGDVNYERIAREAVPVPGGGGATPFVAGQAIKAGEIKFNSATPPVFFTTLADKVAPQAEPFLPASASQVNALYRKLYDDAALRQALANKASLVGGKVPIAEIPTATAADVAAGVSAATVVTPAGLKQAGLAVGGLNFLGEWNPNKNRLARTGFAIGEASAPKGAYYYISEKAVPFLTTASLPTTNDTYVSVSSSAGIGSLHLVSGSGVPPNTRVVNVEGSSIVVLSNNVTLASGQSLTFTPQIGTNSVFPAGSYLMNGGPVEPRAVAFDNPNVWYVQNMGAPQGPGGDALAVLPYAASLALDFAGASRDTIRATGNLAITGTTNAADGKTKRVFVYNDAATSIALAWPSAWRNLPAAPATLAAGKLLIVTLEATGAAESTVIAAFGAQS